MSKQNLDTRPSTNSIEKRPTVTDRLDQNSLNKTPSSISKPKPPVTPKKK